jgi:chromosome partitioning protein
MRIFISYSTHDFEQAKQLADALSALGHNPWFAPADMKAGRFTNQLAEFIANCDLFAVVASAQAAYSTWVEREFLYAQALNKPVAPVIVSPVPPRSALALLIANLNFVDARNQPMGNAASQLLATSQTHRNGRVIASFNMKGGVGKTVLAGNVAAAFSISGKVPNVLLIDWDPQFNLSQMFFDDETIERAQKAGRSLAAVFAGNVATETSGLEHVFPLTGPALAGSFSRRVDLLLGHDELFNYAINRRTEDQRDVARRSIQALISKARANYDVVIIDVNPSASFPTLTVVEAADHFIVPVRPERFAIRGVDLLKRFVENVRKRPLTTAEFSIVVNEVAASANSAKRESARQATVEGIQSDDQFGPSLVPGFIPFHSALQSPPIDDPLALPIQDATVFGRPAGPIPMRALVSLTAKVVADRAGIAADWPLNLSVEA